MEKIKMRWIKNEVVYNIAEEKDGIYVIKNKWVGRMTWDEPIKTHDTIPHKSHWKNKCLDEFCINLLKIQKMR